MTPNLSQLRQALAVWEMDDAFRDDAMLDDIFAAARLFLAEREGGQKVWWCEEHRAASSAEDDEELCEVAGMVMFLETVLPERPCRMVEAWLTVETSE